MSPPRPRIGIAGLGIMGGIMARALLAQGCEVWGHDPVARRRRHWQRAGVHTPGSNAEVAKQADVLLVSLPSVHALQAWLALEAP